MCVQVATINPDMSPADLTSRNQDEAVVADNFKFNDKKDIVRHIPLGSVAK